MGTASEVAYWAPAAVLVVTLVRVWWPALVVMAVCLVGVGVTMFGAFPLPIHLSWLAAAVLVVVAVFTGLVGGGHDDGERPVGAPRVPPSGGPRAAV